MAARAWVRGELVDKPVSPIREEDDALTDAKRLGMDEAQIAELTRQLGGNPEGFQGVWPVNLSAVRAFMMAGSQWRTAIVVRDGFVRTSIVGLDYAGAAVAWGANAIELSADLFARLTVLEEYAARALNGEIR